MKKLIVLICFLFILIGCGKGETIMINKVTCDEVKELVKEGAILIDVREQDEYNQEHLDGAVNIS